uniref:G-protein coupled receptors family 1 profile domain-containing protein n=1 Tax=Panagrolaimus sp. JU765 TaxID=591449 RepID=A0AC34R618_9BILA
MKYPIFFVKESWPGFDSYWTLILSVNRCFAIGFPILNRKIWTKWTMIATIIALYVITVVIALVAYDKGGCLFELFSSSCMTVNTEGWFTVTVISLINNMLCLVIIFIGIIMYRQNKTDAAHKNIKKIEKLLVFQTFL